MGVTGNQGNQGNQRDASVGSSGKRGAYQFALAQGAKEGTVNRRWKVILGCLRGAGGAPGATRGEGVTGRRSRGPEGSPRWAPVPRVPRVP